eukprot:457726_1
MPNWHYTTLIIHGTVNNLNLFYNTNKSDDRELDFNQQVPSKQDDNWYDNNIENWGTKWNATEVECNINFISSQRKLVYKYQTAWGQADGWLDTILEQYANSLVFRTITESESWDGVMVTDYVNGKQIKCKHYNNGISFYCDYFSSHIPNLMQILFDNGIVPNSNVIAEVKYEEDDNFPTRKYHIQFLNKQQVINDFNLRIDDLQQIYRQLQYLTVQTNFDDANIDKTAINIDQFAELYRYIYINSCSDALSNYKKKLLSNAIFTSYLLIGIDGTTIHWEQIMVSLAALNEDTLMRILKDYCEGSSNSKAVLLQSDLKYIAEINDNKTWKQELYEYKESYCNVIIEMEDRCNCYQQLCDVWNKESGLPPNKQIFMRKVIQLIENQRMAVRCSHYGIQMVESLLQMIDSFLWSYRYLDFVHVQKLKSV